MEIIKNFLILNDILGEFAKKRSITNNYFLLSNYEQFIKEGKLFYFNTDYNVCILVEHETYLQLYYYINDKNEIIYLDNNKPVTMEILYRNEIDRPDYIFDFWRKCGFQTHITRENMVTSYKQVTISHDADVESQKIAIRFAKNEEEAVFIQELIEKTFDKYTGDILTYNETLDFVKRGMVLCAYYDEKPCGLLQFEIKNNVVIIGHLVVAPEFNGLGIASKLVKAFITENAVDVNTRYQLWVISDNNKAKALYNRFGFVYGNKTSASMLKE